MHTPNVYLIQHNCLWGHTGDPGNSGGIRPVGEAEKRDNR